MAAKPAAGVETVRGGVPARVAVQQEGAHSGDRPGREVPAAQAEVSGDRTADNPGRGVQADRLGDYRAGVAEGGHGRGADLPAVQRVSFCLDLLLGPRVAAEQ